MDTLPEVIYIWLVIASVYRSMETSAHKHVEL